MILTPFINIYLHFISDYLQLNRKFVTLYQNILTAYVAFRFSEAMRAFSAGGMSFNLAVMV